MALSREPKLKLVHLIFSTYHPYIKSRARCAALASGVLFEYGTNQDVTKVIPISPFWTPYNIKKDIRILIKILILISIFWIILIIILCDYTNKSSLCMYTSNILTCVWRR